MGVRVVAIGGSAGAVEALETLVAGLPADLGAAVLITVHITATARSALPQILTRAGSLPAFHAGDAAPMQENTIIVAPPDRHLLVRGERVRLSSGTKVNRHRPAIDVMFTSAARWAGPDLVAVVLSGTLDDGAVGAALAHRAGAQVIVQNDARFPGMPRAALAAVPRATQQPLTRLATAITTAVRSRPPSNAEPAHVREDTSMSMAESADPGYLEEPETRLTRLVCPDCGGALAEADLPTITYYRCHVGHQWSPQSLAAAQADTAESKLWAAVAALEELAALRRHLATSLEHQPPADPAVRDEAAYHLSAAQQAADLAHSIKEQFERSKPATRPPLT